MSWSRSALGTLRTRTGEAKQTRVVISPLIHGRVLDKKEKHKFLPARSKAANAYLRSEKQGCARRSHTRVVIDATHTHPETWM
jgi:hypothetical protein